MKSITELSISAVNQKRQESGEARSPRLDVPVLPEVSIEPSLGTRMAVEGEQDQPAENELGLALPFDPCRVADALWKSAGAASVCGILVAGVVFIAAKIRMEPHYKASAQLVRQTTPDSFRASDVGEPYKPQEIPFNVLSSSVMRERSLMERVAAVTSPAMRPQTVLAGIEVTTDRKSEVIQASFTSDVSPARAVEVINRYAEEVVKLTKEMQNQDASDMNTFLKSQLAYCDMQLERVNEQLLKYAKDSDLLDGDKEMDAYLSERGNLDLKYEGMRIDYDTADLKIQAVERELAKVSPVAEELQKAREDLTQLLTRYTEQNPVVQEQQSRIKNLEIALKKQDQPHETAPPQSGENSIAGSLYLQRIELLTQKLVLGEQMKKLESSREKLSEKLNQLPRKTLEYALIRGRRQSLESTRQLLAGRQREAELFMNNSLGCYRVLQNARVEDVVSDSRRSQKVLYCIAGFGGGFLLIALVFVLRELADGRVKTPADLRRITRLPVLASLSAEANNDPAERDTWAFRTWTRLQSKLRQPDSALICGMLTASDAKTCSAMTSLLAEAAGRRGGPVVVITGQPPEDRPTLDLAEVVSRSFSDQAKWLSAESGVVFLHADDSWTWSPAQRGQLENALRIWSHQREAIVLVELPPASLPETLLMAERLPQLLWVEEGGQKPGSTLHETLTTFRDAGCNLLGALLHRAPCLKPAMLNQYAGTIATLVLACMISGVSAADAPQDQPPSASKSSELTLGAGDKINITMFGHPEMERKELALNPDGRLTYLQARDVPAAGLTLDQLREKLNDELKKFYNRPSVIVTPFQFQSRKVYILGKVVKKGMVNMDRPLTLLEAITEAGGLETGLFQQNTVELADLGRSFLMRREQRMKVDFEALFGRGDMTQNITLEPDDYIYFPSANNNEIYLVGAVNRGGTQGLLGKSTVISVITSGGGFTSRAYRERVLVVRGSLDKPQTFVVNIAAMLSGREKGFKLEPNDIVYVADKPWARAEELLEMALTTFFQGAVAGYTTTHVGPLIKHPFISE